MDFFKHPSLKFNKTLLVRYCPHRWVWKTYLRMLLNFFHDWTALLEHCVHNKIHPCLCNSWKLAQASKSKRLPSSKQVSKSVRISQGNLLASLARTPHQRRIADHAKEQLSLANEGRGRFQRVLGHTHDCAFS